VFLFLARLSGIWSAPANLLGLLFTGVGQVALFGALALGIGCSRLDRQSLWQRGKQLAAGLGAARA